LFEDITTTTTTTTSTTTTTTTATNNTIINNILAAIQFHLQSAGLTSTTATTTTTAPSSHASTDLFWRFFLAVAFLVFIVVGVGSIVWYKIQSLSSRKVS
jgi:hypothetical protein